MPVDGFPQDCFKIKELDLAFCYAVKNGMVYLIPVEFREISLSELDDDTAEKVFQVLKSGRGKKMEEAFIKALLGSF